jgi:hypothetical protein
MQNAWGLSSGAMWLVAITIMGLILIGLLMSGVDFRFALMFLAPLLLAFADDAWIPTWIGGLVWIFIVGFTMFIAWNRFKETY